MLRSRPNGASDKCLHCLLMIMFMQNAAKVKIFTTNPQNYEWAPPNNKDGKV